MPRFAAVCLALGLSAATAAAWSQTTVDEAWIRATVAQQKATGLFARITSKAGGRLVSASSPVAGVVEVHQMSMEGNVMRMRALPDGLPLPAGQPVKLEPGGYHVMLLDLKQTPLQDGETVPVTLVIEGADQQRETIELKVPVKSAQGAAMQHKR